MLHYPLFAVGFWAVENNAEMIREVRKPQYTEGERVWWRSFCLVPRKIQYISNAGKTSTFWVWLEYCEKSRKFDADWPNTPILRWYGKTERRLTEALKLKVGIKW